MYFLVAGVLVIACFIGFPILLYVVLKKLGYPKTGKILSITCSIIILIIALLTIFEDQLFFKKNAKKLLSEQDIALIDEFEIIENKSMTAIGEYYHTFSLKISPKDKQLIIDQIKKSENFKSLNDKIEDFLSISERYEGGKIIQNYEDSSQFVREYLKSNERGYEPTYRKIEIEKTDNKLIFEEIDD
jgi:hypothetical protein